MARCIAPQPSTHGPTAADSIDQHLVQSSWCAACLTRNTNSADCVLRHLQGPSIAIHHSEEVLSNMNDWCKEHHNKSGLVQRVRDSTVTLQQAEQQVLSFVQQHTEFQTAQLAGNSVHVDRLFLQRHMPRLLEHLHYRIVDVSTFKECCRCISQHKLDLQIATCFQPLHECCFLPAISTGHAHVLEPACLISVVSPVKAFGL